MSRRELLAREVRLALPVAILTMLSVICLVGANFILGGVLGDTDGDAEALRAIDGKSGTFTLSFIVQAVGFLLLAPPLLYLFRATAARSSTVRTQLVGVLYAAPIFLGVFAILGGLSTLNAASDFVAANIAGTGKAANDAARDAINSGGLRSAAAGFGLAGQIGFAIGMAYTCMQAMKAGLLPRFWGSLGAALGIVSFLFFQFALLWFIYLGLLVAGWVPGGRPPAWAEGRAIPWPKPGEEFAREYLSGGDDEGEGDADDDADGEWILGPDEQLLGPDEPDAPDKGERAAIDPNANGAGGDPTTPPRKRKRRN